jgi:alkaline phosphatase
VVIGDHETGGLALVPNGSGALQAVWADTDHSATLVPVFARGPGAEQFGGIHSGAEIGSILLDLVAGATGRAGHPD